MPELPEVETIRRTLKAQILNASITGVEVLWPKSLANITAGELAAVVEGQKVSELCRRGKYLILDIAGSGFLVVHLRMTGRLVVCHRPRPDDHPVDVHTRVIFHLSGPDSESRELHFIDQRKFGRLWWARDEEQLASIVDLGPEPLSDDFTAAYLQEVLSKGRRNIKAILLDQSKIAGLGNIYADESLYLAGIHPARSGSELTEEETGRLWHSIRSALEKAIENGGTTFRDYADGEGRSGRNQDFLQVYGRGGQPCYKCGSRLERIRVAGRGTVFCPRCQI